MPNRDVVLRGNSILGYADPARPLTHGPQGIGNFDGPYIDWLVENNVVMVAHHHGISVYGSENARIINNTVIDISGRFDSWIKLSDSNGGIVRNNLAPDFQVSGVSGLVFDHNLTLNGTNIEAIFRDMQNGDLRLKAGGAAIDAGSIELSPAKDIGLRPRPIGGAVDIGAYEFTLDADFDSDGDVDGNDLLHWQRGFGQPTRARPVDGDADGNGAVDFEDLDIWKAEYDSSMTSGAVSNALTSIPEPEFLSISAVAWIMGFRIRPHGSS